jgi:hypothetical protein
MIKETINYNGHNIVKLGKQPGFWVTLKYGILYNKTLEEAQKVIDYIKANRPEMF